MTFLDDATRRRILDNGLAQVINTLSAIKNQHGVSDEEKLRALGVVEKIFPELKRVYIYFINTKRGM